MNTLLRSGKARVGPFLRAHQSQILSGALLLMLAAMALAGGAHGVYAATATPVPPTATIGLTIPTNTLLSSSNDWLQTFAPIAAIGIGISIALAVLGFLGKEIVAAFRA